MKTSFFLMLCCFPLLTACNGQKQEMPGEKYKTLTVSTTNQTLQSTYPATLRGRQAVEVRPQVSGTITRICINEGDVVSQGQVLFIIDQVPYKAALETALANVKSAEAKLQTARLTANSKEELYKAQVVSDFDRQTARNQLLEAEAALAQAKAEETNARNNLSYTEVKSPLNGVASMIPIVLARWWTVAFLNLSSLYRTMQKSMPTFRWPKTRCSTSFSNMAPWKKPAGKCRPLPSP